MAELDPALQDDINNLQARHTALVDAVRNYSGGSIAEATNDLLAAQAQTESTIDKRETALLGLIQRNTDKPVPSLLSDFATRTYMTGVRRLEHGVGIHDMWDISRASAKWAWGPNGKLTEVSANEPAYHYDPVTGEPQGVLIEEERTNLLLWSEDFTNSAWDKVRTSVSPTSEPSPIEGCNWTALIEDAVDSSFFLRQSVDTLTPGNYRFHAIVRPRSGNRDLVVWAYNTDPAGGGVVNLESASYSLGEITPLNGGAYLISCEWNPTYIDAGAYLGIRLLDKQGNYSYLGDGSSGIDVAAIWLTDAPTPSSYIPTTDSPVTRAADNVSRVLGDEYNPNGFSVYAEAQQNSDKGSVIFLNNGGLSNSIRVGLPSNGDRAMFLTVDGSIRKVVDLSEFSNYTKGDPAKIVLAVDPNNNRIRLTINGETVENRTGYFPSLDEIRLGGITPSNNNINGTIHDFIMYPRALTASEAEEMTS